MSYNKKVIDRCDDPKNVGTLDKNSSFVGTGLVGAPSCGDVMQLQIRINEKTGIIEDAKFKTFGCGAAIASSSLITEKIIGINVNEAQRIKNTEIAEELNLPPIKLHCSVLAEGAVKAAIEDYNKKNRND